VKVLNVYEGGWVTSDAPASMISSYYFRAALEGFDPLTGEKIVLKETPKDKAMGASAALSEKNLGGIDLSKVTLRVQGAEEGGIQLNFNDPAMLQLLLSADGLTPLIYDVNPMTPAMIDRFVGIK
jgi:hypothetical protein